MIKASNFRILDDKSVRKLDGGIVFHHYYFLGIQCGRDGEVFTSVIRARLTVQCQSQRRNTKFPNGYEPFDTCYGEWRYCLATKTFPVPKLKLVPAADRKTVMPKVVLVRRPASILDPKPNSAEYVVLLTEHHRFELECTVRNYASRGMAELHVALDLLRPDQSSDAGSADDLASRFEKYLEWAEPQKLRDLVSLLSMPEPQPGPSILGFPPVLRPCA